MNRGADVLDLGVSAEQSLQVLIREDDVRLLCGFLERKDLVFDLLEGLGRDRCWELVPGDQLAKLAQQLVDAVALGRGGRKVAAFDAFLAAELSQLSFAEGRNAAVGAGADEDELARHLAVARAAIELLQPVFDARQEFFAVGRVE